jgi:hypothetical protein
MIRGRLAVFLLTIGLGACPEAFARIGNTWQDELRIYSADIATQCSAVTDQLKDFKVRADPLTGYTLKDAVQSLCVCLPAKTQAFASTLSADELARTVSEEEVRSRFDPAVIDKCAAEQMQSMYGEECRKRFKKAAHIDVPRYCSCMKEVVGGYSEATTAAIAAAAGDYLPLAAEAEKNGEPVPARPPVLEAYFQADHGCKTGKEAPKAAQH